MSSNVPEGATLSDDGRYWWDGTSWVEVGDGSAQAGTAAFDFDWNGVRIDAETSPVPSEGEALKAAFNVCNTGSGAGTCTVTIRVDGQDAGVSWDSPMLAPGQCTAPDGDGYVHGIPSQTEGEHLFEAMAQPPGSGGGRAENRISVGMRE